MLILQMKLPESSNGVEDTAGNNGEINYEKYINDVLKSNNSGDIAKWINRKFHKLQPFFSYLLKNNNGELDHDRQLAIFNGVCNFINKIGENHEFANIFDTFPRTPIDKYHEETVGEQFSQLSGLKKWTEDNMPDGGSCHYRSLMFYNIFSKLKEAGLELEIKFFKEKYKYKINNQSYNMQHSGLVVTFQKQNYLVDRGDNDGHIIVNINDEIFNVKIEISLGNSDKHLKYLIHYYSTLLQSKATDDITFFYSLKDFVNNLNTYRAVKRLSFYLNLGNLNGEKRNNKLSHISFSFVEGGIFIVIDKKGYTFKLDVDKISIKSHGNGYNIYYNDVILLDSPQKICENLTYVIENKKKRLINQADKELLNRVLPFIFKRTDISITDFFHEYEKYISETSKNS